MNRSGHAFHVGESNSDIEQVKIGQLAVVALDLYVHVADRILLFKRKYLSCRIQARSESFATGMLPACSEDKK